MTNLERRNNVFKSLNETSNGVFSERVNSLTHYLYTSFWKYGGLDISECQCATKAGRIEINKNSGTITPSLKLVKCESVEKSKSSAYLIVVDGKIAKIGGLSDGICGSSFGQYLSGITGNPSKRSVCGYFFMLKMCEEGHEVEIYHITSDKVGVTINTIGGPVTDMFKIDHNDLERLSVEGYKRMTDGTVPFLNIKEKNATYPKELDVIYSFIYERGNKLKKYNEGVALSPAYVKASYG